MNGFPLQAKGMFKGAGKVFVSGRPDIENRVNEVTAKPSRGKAPVHHVRDVEK